MFYSLAPLHHLRPNGFFSRGKICMLDQFESLMSWLLGWWTASACETLNIFSLPFACAKPNAWLKGKVRRQFFDPYLGWTWG